jgi:hypothetical protein
MTLTNTVRKVLPGHFVGPTIHYNLRRNGHFLHNPYPCPEVALSDIIIETFSHNFLDVLIYCQLVL